VSGLPEQLRGWLLTLAGAAAVTAFAPFGWFPLAFMALALLFYQWQSDTPALAFRHGALFGLGYFGAGVSWVFVSVHVYGHVPVPAAVLVTVLFVLVMLLFPALAGLTLKRLFPVPTQAVLLLGFPAGWVVFEWLRGWVFTGFPWLTIGTSQIDSWLGGYAPLLGVYGPGWAVALTAAALVALVRERRRLPALAVLAVMWSGGYLLDRVDWVQPRGAALDVVVVQGNIAQENKWAPENLLNTFTRYAELTFEQPGSDLVVWPETAIPAFYHQVEESFIPYLESRLEENGATLLTGIPVLDRQAWQYYNAVIALGAGRTFYYKRHLVPFGEYLPLRWLIGDTLDALAVPNADFSSGPDTQLPLQAAGYPVAASICFEVVFSEEIRRSLPAAALLVNVSNDAWFSGSLAPHQHLEMARMRARETGRPMLRATNTGISAIIDADGQVLARSLQDEVAVVSGQVVPMQGATPYVRYGNAVVVALVFGCLLLAWMAGRRGHESER
jgi:apolipoprotein N-acyltransferase